MPGIIGDTHKMVERKGFCLIQSNPADIIIKKGLWNRYLLNNSTRLSYLNPELQPTCHFNYFRLEQKLPL